MASGINTVVTDTWLVVTVSVEVEVVVLVTTEVVKTVVLAWGGGTTTVAVEVVITVVMLVGVGTVKVVAWHVTVSVLYSMSSIVLVQVTSWGYSFWQSNENCQPNRPHGTFWGSQGPPRP